MKELRRIFKDGDREMFALDVPGGILVVMLFSGYSSSGVARSVHSVFVPCSAEEAEQWLR